MADYWCENCGGSRIRSILSVLRHLRDEHGINVKPNSVNYCKTVGFHIPAFRCHFCGKTISAETFWEAYCEMKGHLKQHSKYICDGRQFNNKRSLLLYIDQKYGIQICYVCGMSKKRVFLDGITR